MRNIWRYSTAGSRCLAVGKERNVRGTDGERSDEIEYRPDAGRSEKMTESDKREITEKISKIIVSTRFEYVLFGQ